MKRYIVYMEALSNFCSQLSIERGQRVYLERVPEESGKGWSAWRLITPDGAYNYSCGDSSCAMGTVRAAEGFSDVRFVTLCELGAGPSERSRWNYMLGCTERPEWWPGLWHYERRPPNADSIRRWVGREVQVDSTIWGEPEGDCMRELPTEFIQLRSGEHISVPFAKEISAIVFDYVQNWEELPEVAPPEGLKGEDVLKLSQWHRYATNRPLREGRDILGWHGTTIQGAEQIVNFKACTDDVFWGKRCSYKLYVYKLSDRRLYVVLLVETGRTYNPTRVWVDPYIFATPPLKDGGEQLSRVFRELARDKRKSDLRMLSLTLNAVEVLWSEGTLPRILEEKGVEALDMSFEQAHQ